MKSSVPGSFYDDPDPAKSLNADLDLDPCTMNHANQSRRDLGYLLSLRCLFVCYCRYIRGVIIFVLRSS